MLIRIWILIELWSSIFSQLPNLTYYTSILLAPDSTSPPLFLSLSEQFLTPFHIIQQSSLLTPSHNLSLPALDSALSTSFSSSNQREDIRFVLAIEGNFTDSSVSIDNFTLNYEQLQLIVSGLKLHKSLILYLFGSGSSAWIESCLQNMDYDTLQIFAISDQNLQSCVSLTQKTTDYLTGDKSFCSIILINTNYETQNQQTSISYSLLSDSKHLIHNSLVLNIAHQIRLYINRTTGSCFIITSYNEYFYGRLTPQSRFNQPLYIQLRQYHYNATISSLTHTLLVQYSSSQSFLFSYMIDFRYWGSIQQSKLQGWGLSVRGNGFIYYGTFYKGFHHGKGAQASCDKSYLSLCDGLFISGSLTDTSFHKSQIYYGSYFYDNKTKGVERKSVTLFAGRFQQLGSKNVESGFGYTSSIVNDQVFAGVNQIGLGIIIQSRTKYGKLWKFYGGVQNFAGLMHGPHSLKGIITSQKETSYLNYDPISMKGLVATTSLNNTLLEYGMIYSKKLNGKGYCAPRRDRPYWYRGDFSEQNLHGIGTRVFKNQIVQRGYFVKNTFTRGSQWKVMQDSKVLLTTKRFYRDFSESEETILIQSDKEGLKFGGRETVFDEEIRLMRNNKSVVSQSGRGSMKISLGEE